MAKKKKGKKTRKARKGPSMKARKKYNQLIVKSYKRLHAVVKKHAPEELIE